MKSVKKHRIIILIGIFILGGGYMMHRNSDYRLSAEIPEQLIDFAEKYPEAQEFVKNYPKEHDKSHKIDLTKEVRQGEIPLFLQWDKRWGYQPYGDGWIADSGCGPTCMAMVVCGLTGNPEWSPLKMAEFSENQGYYIPDVGTSWDLMTTGAELIGIHGTETEISEEMIYKILSEKKPMICSMSPGDFTTGGHFIVLTGIDKENHIIVNDPNSNNNSQKHWDIQVLIPQIKHIWYYTV